MYKNKIILISILFNLVLFESRGQDYFKLTIELRDKYDNPYSGDKVYLSIPNIIEHKPLEYIKDGNYEVILEDKFKRGEIVVEDDDYETERFDVDITSITPRYKFDLEQIPKKINFRIEVINKKSEKNIDSVRLKLEKKVNGIEVDIILDTGIYQGNISINNFITNGKKFYSLKSETFKTGYKNKSKTLKISEDSKENQFEIPMKRLKCLPKYSEYIMVGLFGISVGTYLIFKDKAEDRYNDYQHSTGIKALEYKEKTKNSIKLARASLMTMGASATAFFIHRCIRKKRNRADCMQKKELTIDIYSPLRGTYGITLVKRF